MMDMRRRPTAGWDQDITHEESPTRLFTSKQKGDSVAGSPIRRACARWHVPGCISLGHVASFQIVFASLIN
jgi:hypothetical protein